MTIHIRVYSNATASPPTGEGDPFDMQAVLTVICRYALISSTCETASAPDQLDFLAEIIRESGSATWFIPTDTAIQNKYAGDFSKFENDDGTVSCAGRKCWINMVAPGLWYSTGLRARPLGTIIRTAEPGISVNYYGNNFGSPMVQYGQNRDDPPDTKALSARVLQPDIYVRLGSKYSVLLSIVDQYFDSSSQKFANQIWNSVGPDVDIQQTLIDAGVGPNDVVTVFVPNPSGQAFPDFVINTMDNYIQDPKYEFYWKTIVKAWVVPGKYYGNNFTGTKILRNLLGDRIIVQRQSPSNVTVNQNRIEWMNGLLNNAVFHYVEGVIYPDSVRGPWDTLLPPRPDVVASSIAVQRIDTFSTLITSPLYLDILAKLQYTPETFFTVFAPSNNAMALAGVNPNDYYNVGATNQLLKYHIVPEALPSTNVPSGESVHNTLADLPLTLMRNEFGIYVSNGKDTAKVVLTDGVTKSGIVHVIDKVLSVPELPMQTLKEQGYTAFAGALQEQGQSTTVDYAPAMTVFAMPDQVYPYGQRVDTTQYLVTKKVYLANIPLGATSSVKTVNGAMIYLTYNNLQQAWYANNAKLVPANLDMYTLNGAIHTLDRPLQFDASDLIFKGPQSGGPVFQAGVKLPAKGTAAAAAGKPAEQPAQQQQKSAWGTAKLPSKGSVPPVLTSCFFDNQCSNGDLCVDFVCKTPNELGSRCGVLNSPVNPKNLGQCRKGLTCKSNVCMNVQVAVIVAPQGAAAVYVPPGMCFFDSDCPLPEMFCVSQSCSFGSTYYGPCAVTGQQCITGLVCTSGKCLLKGQTLPPTPASFPALPYIQNLSAFNPVVNVEVTVAACTFDNECTGARLCINGLCDPGSGEGGLCGVVMSDYGTSKYLGPCKWGLSCEKNVCTDPSKTNSNDPFVIPAVLGSPTPKFIYPQDRNSWVSPNPAVPQMPTFSWPPAVPQMPTSSWSQPTSSWPQQSATPVVSVPWSVAPVPWPVTDTQAWVSAPAQQQDQQYPEDPTPGRAPLLAQPSGPRCYWDFDCQLNQFCFNDQCKKNSVFGQQCGSLNGVFWGPCAVGFVCQSNRCTV